MLQTTSKLSSVSNAEKKDFRPPPRSHHPWRLLTGCRPPVANCRDPLSRGARAKQDMYLKRTTFSSPHTATTCIHPVRMGDGGIGPSALHTTHWVLTGPPKVATTAGTAYWPVPLLAVMTRDTVHHTRTRLVHHHSSMAGEQRPRFNVATPFTLR